MNGPEGFIQAGRTGLFFGLPALDVAKQPTQEGGCEKRRGARIFRHTSALPRRNQIVHRGPQDLVGHPLKTTDENFLFRMRFFSAPHVIFVVPSTPIASYRPNLNVYPSGPIRPEPPKKFTPSWQASSPPSWRSGRGGARPMPWPAASRCIPKTLSIPGCRRARPWPRRRRRTGTAWWPRTRPS